MGHHNVAHGTHPAATYWNLAQLDGILTMRGRRTHIPECDESRSILNPVQYVNTNKQLTDRAPKTENENVGFQHMRPMRRAKAKNQDTSGNTSITFKVSKVPISDGKCIEVHFQKSSVNFTEVERP